MWNLALSWLLPVLLVFTSMLLGDSQTPVCTCTCNCGSNPVVYRNSSRSESTSARSTRPTVTTTSTSSTPTQSTEPTDAVTTAAMSGTRSTPKSTMYHGNFLFNRRFGFTWTNCGTDNDWVHITKLNLEPTPIILPGNLYVTLEGRISHSLGNQLTMDIIVEKRLLGTWVIIPCSTDGLFGTCHYTDPCHFLHRYEVRGHCPLQLAVNGIDCTCPFNPKTLNLPRTRFHLPPVSDGFQGFFRDNHEYRLTIKLNDKHHGNSERMCVKMISRVHVV